jgi:hypothetical protein
MAEATLYQMNTRVRLTELSMALGRQATLDDLPDSELSGLADRGINWVWLLSVWQTGPAGRAIDRADPDLRRTLADILPDARDEDIAGSGFAITAYTVDARLGGDAALARLRARMRRAGLKLMLDFVPNHTAIDHPWVTGHPDYYITGTEADLARAPLNYIRIGTPGGDRILAHGRDPYFPGWTDTLQLNYANPATQDAMIAEFESIAARCDGARCDMAMLLLPETFARTWGLDAQPFWPRAIARVRAHWPNFRTLAEVYWNLEPVLLQQGFDYAYDKALYDALRAGDARAVRDHLKAPADYQVKLARFLENHDEPAAAATFPPGMHQAAAVITYFSPGLRFFHQGQFEGRRLHIPAQVIRAPAEPTDSVLQSFYDRLLAALRLPAVANGAWRLLDCAAAWEGNWTWDCYVAWCWEAEGRERLLVVVNYAAHQSQCRVRLPWPDLDGRNIHLKDALSPAAYDRDGAPLLSQGLYLDLPPWGRHVFVVSA